ncbi:hypothetical protein S83_036243 [Arachis hypogaea]
MFFFLLPLLSLSLSDATPSSSSFSTVILLPFLCGGTILLPSLSSGTILLCSLSGTVAILLPLSQAWCSLSQERILSTAFSLFDSASFEICKRRLHQNE